MKIRKVLTLPGVLETDTVYVVKSTDPTSTLDYQIMHMTNNAGTISYSGITFGMIDSHIDNKINAYSSAASSTKIYATYAAMLAATAPLYNEFAHVIDATGDVTVVAGGATYLYNFNTATYVKVSEFESMDVIIDWVNVVNKPAYLALLSIDVNSRLTFDGNILAYEDTFVQEW